jgi:hypothetical protein
MSLNVEKIVTKALSVCYFVSAAKQKPQKENKTENRTKEIFEKVVVGW